MNSRETDLTKQESSSTSDTAQTFNASSTTTTWSRLKDPRIVRVSRAFGGKDRHSKVCTVRGLRDRRVRLSVPTAIQLYDLQDRLGLNQPSKVVDWLLNAAKHEIDELPPLQFPQGSFSASLLPMLNNSHQIRPPDQQSDKQGGLSKDVSAERDENQYWPATARSSEEAYVSASSQNPSSSIPINSFVRWDPSNLSLSHPPRIPQDWHNFSLSPLSAGSQVLVYQPAAPGVSAQPCFHSQISNAEFDTKHLNFQTSQSSLSESSTLPARPIHFNMTANLLPSQNNHGS